MTAQNTLINMIITGGICLMLIPGCAWYSIERRATASFDYGSVRTFSFDNKNSGVVGLAVSERDALIAHIREEIRKELIAQGYIYVGTHADTRIRFGLILQSNGKDIVPRRMPRASRYGSPEYPTTFDYKPGSLIIDSVDPFYGRIAWRSAMDTRIHRDMPLNVMEARVTPMIKLLLKTFPDI